MKVLNLLTACVITTPLLFVSCSDDNVGDINQPSVADGPVTFSIGMGVVTQSRQNSRALPHETGFDYENEIEDAVVIIYDTPLNATGGEIVYKNYFRSSELRKDDSFTGTHIYPTSYDASGKGTTWSTVYSSVNRYEFEFSTELEDGKTYYIVALANVGDLVNAGNLRNQPIANLDDLRNFIYKGDICSAAGYPEDCGRFAMSAIGEEKFTYNKSSLVNNEYSLPDLHVQRLAARIDLIFGKRGNSVADLANGEFDYVILDSPGEYPFQSSQTSAYFPIYDAESGNRISGAVFALDQVAIFNAADDIAGEYLFERNDYYGTTTIFGIEEFNTSLGYASYFVWSPPFPDSNGNPVAEGSQESHISYPALFANKGGTKDNKTQAGFMGVPARVHSLDDGTEYGVLGYVRVNTYRTHSDKNRYTEVFFSGFSNVANGHFDGKFEATYDDSKYVSVYGTIPVRHSTYTIDATQPLQPLTYAIVRNTIYRIKIRFYAKGDTIFARYYYYGTAFDGKEDNADGLGENKYNDIPFYNFVLEGDGKTPND